MAWTDENGNLIRPGHAEEDLARIEKQDAGRLSGVDSGAEFAHERGTAEGRRRADECERLARRVVAFKHAGRGCC